MKVMIIDLDGTLFDTKEVNFRAYQEAILPYGYHIDYDYYCKFCNGRHYMDFLPQITTNNCEILLDIHKRKQDVYRKFLPYSRLNEHLTTMITACRGEYKTALVTTASRQNTYDILDAFDLTGLFDLILTREDVQKSKPNPEGFLKAMKHFESTPEACIVFEDSEVGIEAAHNAGMQCFQVKGFN